MGHHAGIGTLQHVISRTCNYNQAKAIVFTYWDGLVKRGKQKRPASDVAYEDDYGARRAVGFVKALNGGTVPPVKAPTGNCPIGS